MNEVRVRVVAEVLRGQFGGNLKSGWMGGMLEGVELKDQH